MPSPDSMTRPTCSPEQVGVEDDLHVDGPAGPLGQGVGQRPHLGVAQGLGGPHLRQAGATGLRGVADGRVRDLVDVPDPVGGQQHLHRRTRRGVRALQQVGDGRAASLERDRRVGQLFAELGVAVHGLGELVQLVGHAVGHALGAADLHDRPAVGDGEVVSHWLLVPLVVGGQLRDEAVDQLVVAGLVHLGADDLAGDVGGQGGDLGAQLLQRTARSASASAAARWRMPAASSSALARMSAFSRSAWALASSTIWLASLRASERLLVVTTGPLGLGQLGLGLLDAALDRGAPLVQGLVHLREDPAPEDREQDREGDRAPDELGRRRQQLQVGVGPRPRQPGSMRSGWHGASLRVDDEASTKPSSASASTTAMPMNIVVRTWPAASGWRAMDSIAPLISIPSPMPGPRVPRPNTRPTPMTPMSPSMTLSFS
jgi:hypothetical protein